MKAGNPASQPVLEAEARRLAPLLWSAAGGVHLVGHSYGGSVALQMALVWPDRIKSLTLFEPVRFALLLADRDHQATAREIVRIGRRIGWHALSGRLDEAAALFVDYWSGRGAWEATSAARRRAIAERMHKVREEFEALFADTVPASAYARSDALAPYHRQHFPAARAQVVDLIARECPRAEVVRLDGVGHMGPITDPSRVARLWHSCRENRVCRWPPEGATMDARIKQLYWQTTALLLATHFAGWPPDCRWRWR